MANWNLHSKAPDDFFSLFPELHPAVTQVLYNRGLREPQEVETFLHPEYETGMHDPFLFRDMRKAVDRVLSAFEKKEKITVFGDYDADGITASALACRLFSSLGKQEGEDFSIYLPDREKEGYGLNIPAIESLYASGTRLLITADNGITAIDQVARANELGMEVIITDHHSIPEILPPAFAILNPRLPDETYPCKFLCGAGTLFKLLQGILKTAEERGIVPEGFSREASEKWVLDIAAIGTVADMVPLLDENRVIVKYGLLVLNKTRSIGLKYLLENASAGAGAKKLDAVSIGFVIAPRINAAGRLDHSSASYRMLTSDDHTEAKTLADQLEQRNSERRKITEEIVAEAEAQIEAEQKTWPVCVVMGNDWTPGVVGLAASRLVQKYQRPCFVLTSSLGNLLGSGRSIPGFDITGFLRSLDEKIFLKLGGHPQACGFTLADGVEFSAFQKLLTERSAELLNESDFQKVYTADVEIALSDVSWELADFLAQCQPFGMGNPEPIFIIRNVAVSDMATMGETGNHVRMRLSDDLGQKVIRAVGFGLAEITKNITAGDRVDVLGMIDVNEWNGNRELQIRLVDVKKPARHCERSPDVIIRT